MAISVDPVDRSRTLCDALALSFPVLSDPSLEVTKKYGVADEENGVAWPAVFVIRKDGRVAWRAISETYKKRPTAEEMLSRLDGGAGRHSEGAGPPR